MVVLTWLVAIGYHHRVYPSVHFLIKEQRTCSSQSEGFEAISAVHEGPDGYLLKISIFDLITLFYGFHVSFFSFSRLSWTGFRDNITFSIPGVLLPWKMAPRAIKV